MSQIPEDVMKLAHDAALNFGKLTDSDESNSFLNVADQHELAGSIARAILSDRSRSIAETGESETAPQTHVDGSEPVAWQPKYKPDVIAHHRSIGSELCEYAMSVYPTKVDAENYGHGGHEVRPLYASPRPSAGVEAEIASVVQSVNEWDDRTSPDAYPEHLLITSEELADLLRNFAAAIATEGKE